MDFIFGTLANVTKLITTSFPKLPLCLCLCPSLSKTLHRALYITLRPKQDGRRFPDDIFKYIFLNENVWISIKISLKSVPNGPINNIPALGQIMACRRPGDKPLSESMVVRLLTHISVTRPQWDIWSASWLGVVWIIFLLVVALNSNARLSGCFVVCILDGVFSRVADSRHSKYGHAWHSKSMTQNGPDLQPAWRTHYGNTWLTHVLVHTLRKWQFRLFVWQKLLCLWNRDLHTQVSLSISGSGTVHSWADIETAIARLDIGHGVHTLTNLDSAPIQPKTIHCHGDVIPLSVVSTLGPGDPSMDKQSHT